MVDRITAAPLAATERVAAARTNAPVAPATVPAPSAETAPVVQSSGALSGLVAELGAKPPVDAARIARIRQAISDGSYPISPENVADRLIALKLNWIPA